MAEKTPQTFENHPKLVFGFHRVAFLAALFFLVWAITQVIREPGWDQAAFVALAFALILVGFYARTFPNQNQDRIIRLEERMRMREILPPEMQARVLEFTTPQLVALRFASDEELVELSRRVLDEGLTDRKEIKKLVRNWRADDHRI